MPGSATASKYATWSAPGYPLRIESSSQVLDEIRMTAVEGYHRVPHGGVETGGILFGTRQKAALRIKSWRPIDCAYSRGPSFLLSAQEEEALTATLKNFRDDPELARLEPVGFFRAHTRSEILLGESDLAFYNRFFPQPWQIALIVRPASFAPTRGGFFFREPGGEIRTESSYREFTMLPVAPVIAPRARIPDERPMVEEPLPVSLSEPESSPQVPSPPPPVPVPPPPPEPLTPRAPALQRPVPVLPIPVSKPAGSARKVLPYAGLALIAALLIFLLWPSHRGLSLSVADVHGQLRIGWDRAAKPVTDASAGSIDIDDRGVHTVVNLTPADLRSGNLFYARQSGDVSVRMSVLVPGKQPLAESARFLKPGDNAPLSAATRTELPKPSPAPVEPASKSSPAPAAAPPQPSPAPATPPPVVQPAPDATASTSRVTPFRPPPAAPRKAQNEIPAIAPPSIDSAQSIPPAGLSSVLGAPHAAAPAAPARPAAGAPATVTGVSTGRIIWTGRLAKNQRLTIERNHASTGSIIGMLPGTSSHVSAAPGDLTANGIAIYTADPRYSQPVTEKAGAGNGWNTTTYTLDPKRASGIHVVEQPSAQNGYKLVVESTASKVSVLMIDWREGQ